MSVFMAKMHRIRFRPGLRPRPLCGSLQRSPRPPSWIKGPIKNLSLPSTKNGREGKKRKGGWDGREERRWKERGRERREEEEERREGEEEGREGEKEGREGEGECVVVISSYFGHCRSSGEKIRVVTFWSIATICCLTTTRELHW